MPKSYKREKPTGDYDFVIIGSGMSGIGVAAMLAREGRRCLVLERHYTPGGFTHVFKRRGYEWDVGIHYIGEVNRPGSGLSRMFNYITDGSLEWADMGEVYDRIFFGKQRYDLVKGADNFKAKLKEYFPDHDDQRAIDRYVNLIREASSAARPLFTTRALPPLARRLTGGLLARKTQPFLRRTTREVLEELTSNEELIGVLTGQYGDYGLPPGQSSFLMHAMVARHYLNGGAYPVGGSSRIFEAVEPVIESAGGEVFVCAEVEHIIVEGGRATGVRMADGTEIRAPRIISSAGVHVTYGQLLAGEPKAASMSQAMEKLEPSAAHLCLYVGFQHRPEELQLPKSNFWIYPDHYNHDENLARYLADPDSAEFPLVYISFPAAKDPDFQNRYPGRSTIEIITLGDYQRFRQWEAKPWKKRGEDYTAYKEQIARRLLAKLYEYLPQLEGKVDYYELSTPLTTQHFINYPHGEIYGLASTPGRFDSRAISVFGPVKNLFLTGQDIATCGVGGALAAAMITASAIVSPQLPKKIMAKAR